MYFFSIGELFNRLVGNRKRKQKNICSQSRSYQFLAKGRNLYR